MPRDDWVRLWSLLGTTAYIGAALQAARLAYWKLCEDEAKDFDDVLYIVVVGVLWPLVLVVMFVVWFITREPRRALSESDNRKGLLDIVAEADAKKRIEEKR